MHELLAIEFAADFVLPLSFFSRRGDNATMVV